MSEVVTVGRDLAANVLQVHGADGIDPVLSRKKLRRFRVWCVDISYPPIRRGFLYLVAIMD